MILASWGPLGSSESALGGLLPWLKGSRPFGPFPRGLQLIWAGQNYGERKHARSSFMFVLRCRT